MKLDELLLLDVEDVLRMANDGSKELRAITSRLGSIAQKRTKRLTEQLGKDGLPYVVERFVETGGYKGIRGKSTPQLVAEYQRLRAYLSNKGTTSKGQREYAGEFAERVGLPRTMKYKEVNKIQRALDRLQEANPDLFRSIVTSDQTVEMLRQEVEAHPNKNLDELVEDMQNNLNELYKAQEKARNDTSGFFDDGADKFALGRS